MSDQIETSESVRPGRFTRGQSSSSRGAEVPESEFVPSSLAEIDPFLRVANEIELKNPKVAYQCRCHAFKKAHELDPNSRGRGVLRFKSLLSQRLLKDVITLGIINITDIREIRSFYEEYVNVNVIQALPKASDKADGSCLELTKACKTSYVLFDVLKAIYQSIQSDVPNEILGYHHKVENLTPIYVPYNILPLDPGSKNKVIMSFLEIKAAVMALRKKKEDLPWPEGHEKKPDEDMLDWLQTMFGFQKDNVSNQREHMILLLANVQTRQPPRPHDEQQTYLDVDDALTILVKKLLRNYRKWCRYLDRTSNLWLPTDEQEEVLQQRKLLFMGLYLLIWGEAANLRFMPECLCYIYHHMAFEVFGMLSKIDSKETGQPIKPAYGGGDEAFLKKVVTPIYETIHKEVEKGRRGKHSEWRNYDDLNEYFWSNECFDKLGWPMKDDADFFCKTTQKPRHEESKQKKPKTVDVCVGKVNFVEIRSFWQIFRSFHRMWSFYILCLQAMIIIAWSESRDSHSDVFHKVSSIFITASILNFAQAALDIVLSWEARHSMTKYVKLRYILKAIVAAAWVVLVPLAYNYSHKSSHSLFIMAVFIYLSPNMLSALLFLSPFIRRHIEKSNTEIVYVMMWWCQPRLYIGRGMHESALSLFKYTVFWIVLLIPKLVFSYYVQIKPLVGPTKDILRVYIPVKHLPPFFPHARNNMVVVVMLWSPIILVYFMDTQIWYAILSSIVGGFGGASRNIGEVQTRGMLRSKFHSLPGVFNYRLVPHENTKKNRLQDLLSGVSDRLLSNGQKDELRFNQMWNTIIRSFREEDLISNREMELMLVPHWADFDLNLIRWPLLLLASKVPTALDMVNDNNANDSKLRKRMKEDCYMDYAVRECYASTENLLKSLVVEKRDKGVIEEIFSMIGKHVKEAREEGKPELNLSALPDLYSHLVQLTDLLQKKEEDKDQITIVLMKMLEVVRKDLMKEGIQSLQESSPSEPHQQHIYFNQLKLPKPEGPQIEKIKRLHLLLTLKESAMDAPSNLDAQRRLTFFSNSLFMDMPYAPEVRNMLSFSALTPYYSEDVLFSTKGLKNQNEDGVSILFYLQKIFPDEWKNFLERVKCDNEEDLERGYDTEEGLRLWASYRGQTLTKTVRGMMYYREALELQAFFDLTKDEDKKELMEGYKSEGTTGIGKLIRAKCQALADMKFTYVVSCQNYGIHKRSGDKSAKDIFRLMTTYPSLRVAYIDEVEQTNGEKIYYSVLVKAAPQTNLACSSETVQTLDEQEIYRIKLPGNPILGEGKPENQNHSIIFTRGEGLQTIDMNQDYYIEEAFKMRNLLQEFLIKHGGVRCPTILGLREHIFTRCVSCLAWFMSNQEHSFVTIGQRVLASFLKVRFHYGHPDVFDRVFHLTRGGVSKASKVINLSEDIFAGFNSTLREGNVTHHEYIQVGKGRDVGLNQISMFEAKVANGNGEQTLSRDLYRLGHRFDFFRMMSCYFTTVGFYFCAMLTVLTVYVYLYGRMYLTLSGLGKELRNHPAIHDNKALKTALASQSFVQIGFLLVLPMMMEIGIERGFHNALFDFIWMQLQLASVFFTFQLGTKFHYYCKTLLHGGAEYKGTGRGFVVIHVKFAENYRVYSRSHFVKAFEMMILLLVDQIFGTTNMGLINGSIWFMVGTWLFAPFLFNPSGLEWHKIVDDWTDWKKWVLKYDNGEIGVAPEKSWECWWEKEQEHLRHSGTFGVIVEIVLALRFFIFQYGLVYQFSTFRHAETILVYVASWTVIVIIILIVMVMGVARRRLVVKWNFRFRIIKVFVFLILMSILITFKARRLMTLKDICMFMLAFIPTGWGLLLMAQALKPLSKWKKWSWLWSLVRTLAWSFDILMGFLLLVPVAFLAWFPFVSEFQARILFNQAFSRGLQISRILAGQNRTDLSKIRKDE